MVKKGEILTLRLKDEDKAAIAKAARLRGETVSSFVARVSLREARKTLRKEEEMLTKSRATFKGVPTYFWANCQTASQGGSNSYANAAWHLTIHLDTEVPYDAESDEWMEELEKVRCMIEEDDRDGVWRWFRKTYPRCMELVPSKRKESFLDGVFTAYEQERFPA